MQSEKLNHLTNRIYSTILHFDENIDPEDAWQLSGKIATSNEVTVKGLGLSFEKGMKLKDKLNNLLKPRKSFVDFYNSEEARKERNGN